MRSPWRVSATVCLLVSFASLGATWRSAPAFANGPCIWNQAIHTFTGVEDFGGTAYIAEGNLRDRLVHQCTGFDGSSGASAWVMLSGSGNGSEYAQAGYIKVNQMNNTKTFTEWNDGECGSSCGSSHWTRTLWPGIFQGGHVHEYIIGYSFTTGHVSMAIDNTTYDTTPFSIETEWSAPWHGQWEGELLDYGDDIPGTADAHATFTHIGVQYCRGCAVVDPGDAQKENELAPDTHFQWVNQPVAFDIWDTS